MCRILLVEDEETILFALRAGLFREGYDILTAGSLAEAGILAEENPDLIVLDLGLPDGEGLEFLKRCRKMDGPPVIILTARDEEADIIRGLDMGADDYISKPFNTQEMIARVKAQLRRYMRLGAMNSESMQDSIRIGDLYLDKHAKELNVNGESVHLTATEYKIMELLMSNPGRVFPAEEIYERVWQEPAYSVENTVMVHIRRIREKIEINPKQPKYLKVVWGIGYKIEKDDSKY